MAKSHWTHDQNSWTKCLCGEKVAFQKCINWRFNSSWRIWLLDFFHVRPLAKFPCCFLREKLTCHRETFKVWHNNALSLERFYSEWHMCSLIWTLECIIIIYLVLCILSYMSVNLYSSGPFSSRSMKTCGICTSTLMTSAWSHGGRKSLSSRTTGSSPFLRCWSTPQTLSVTAIWWRNCYQCDVQYSSLATLEWER